MVWPEYRHAVGLANPFDSCFTGRRRLIRSLGTTFILPSLRTPRPLRETRIVGRSTGIAVFRAAGVIIVSRIDVTGCDVVLMHCRVVPVHCNAVLIHYNTVLNHWSAVLIPLQRRTESVERCTDFTATLY